MGTRHVTEVKIGGEIKVAQYGQWDGYPTGQGACIAQFLRDVDLEKFKKQVEALKVYSGNEVETIWVSAGAEPGAPWVSSNVADVVAHTHPELSRDTGAKILGLIHAGTVTKVRLDTEFKKDTLFCEYAYEIDLDKGTIRVNGGKQYKLVEWTRELMDELENAEVELENAC
jgi:hypothetical protein